MISLFLLGLLVLIFVWNLYYARRWNHNLTVALDFAQGYVYAGEQAQITERIENRKRLMLPVLEVAFHMDRRLVFHDCENTNVSDFVYKRDIFALLGNQRITRTLTVDCTQRGYYHIDRSDLTAYSLLHDRRFSAEHPADTSLYVYAAGTDVSDIAVVCEKLMGNIQCARRLYEDPFAFASIREYTLTDPMKTINWKASARTGALMVNTFESTLTEKALIYLDMEDRGILKYEHLTEATVSIAASLARHLIRRGMEVGVYTNSRTDADEAAPPDHAAPAGGPGQLACIERLLAKCTGGERTLPFDAALSVCHDVPEDAVLIFISKNTASGGSAIERFTGRSRQALWVVPYTAGDEACRIDTPDNIRLIRREVAAT